MEQQGSEKLIDRLFQYFQGSNGNGEPEALRGNDPFGFLVSRVSDAILITRKGNIVFANPAACALLGCRDPLALVGTSLPTWYHEKDRHTARQLALGKQPEEDIGTIELLSAENRAIAVELVATRIGEGDLAMSLYRRLQKDTADAKPPDTPPAPVPDTPHVQRAVPLNERDEALVYRSLARATCDALWQWNITTGRVEFSDGLSGLLGIKEGEISRVEQWEAAIHPEDRDAVFDGLEKHLKQGAEYKLEYRLNKGDGQYLRIQELGSVVRDEHRTPVSMVGFITSLECKSLCAETEPVPVIPCLEENVLRSSRLEMIGQLTCGIAHDFNNLLGGIVGHTSRLLIRPQMDARTKESLDTVLGTAIRAAELVDHLLTFARGNPSGDDAGSLNEAVEETLKVISKPNMSLIKIKKKLQPDLPLVQVNRSEIVQVVMNLVLNSIDAMPDGGGMVLETGIMVVPPVGEQATAGIIPGNFAFIRVVDTGHGIPKATIENIFKPFFTTKPTGKGTGLGLAMTDQIVKNNGGFIDVKSQEGKGSVFKIAFPVLKKAD